MVAWTDIQIINVRIISKTQFASKMAKKKKTKRLER